MKDALVTVGVLALVACGRHLSAIDAQRVENMTDEFVSLQRDVPDSGPPRLKAQSGYCTGRSLLRSAEISTADAGAFQCPK